MISVDHSVRVAQRKGAGSWVRPVARSVAFAGGLALAGALCAGGWPGAAFAQSSGEELFGQPVDPDAQMLLEADRLIHDNDDDSITADGNVQIAYDGYTLVAERVTYYRTSGRVIAQGRVEIVEPDGNRIFAEEIDITDDFSDGFVSALRVEAAENTRFAADSAERIDGDVTVFNNGVYTACEPCKENPDKPPLWQIRAARVVVNNRIQRVSYEDARFELFGRPIAYLARFSHADPAIRRKSGLLIPTIQFREDLGVGVTGAYFFNLAPNYDLTLSGSYYTNQGFLGQAEWRHRLHNGAYNLHIAGIHQQSPGDFDPSTYDRLEQERIAVQTSGQFELNPRWQFGWQWLWQSDRNFTRTYGVTSQANVDVTNQVYLTGLAGKNHFDVRTQKFLVQEDLIDSSNDLLNRQPKQAALLPLVDYDYIAKAPVAGGQLSFNFNTASVDRHEANVVDADGTIGLQSNSERFYGVTGPHTRSSAEAEWKSNLITGGGLVVTPSLHGRVDGIWMDTASLGSAANPLMSNESIYRAMPTAGLEIRFPMVGNDAYASHLFEPIAQIFAGTDETDIGRFPNEDAQSMVFGATNLFSRNRFSGYDRIEGGVRANVGFRYSANFAGGALNVTAGQSFHLAGRNSFAQRDLVNAGLESGLETHQSDYVAGAQLTVGSGLTMRLSGRFDERDLAVRRAEASLSHSSRELTTTVAYSFIDAQPNYGFTTDRHEISGNASVRLTDRWRAFGALTFDVENGNVVSDSIGLAYDDSCFSFSLAYSESREAYTGNQTSQAVTFNIGLRTIGNYDYKYALDNTN